MKAQTLYDLRDQEQFCSGSELSEFFAAQTGDPSPSGNVEINTAAAQKFVADCCDTMAHNSPSLADHANRVRSIRLS